MDLPTIKHYCCKLLEFGEHSCAASYAFVEITRHGYVAVTITATVLAGAIVLVVLSHSIELIVERFV